MKRGFPAQMRKMKRGFSDACENYAKVCRSANARLCLSRTEASKTNTTLLARIACHLSPLSDCGRDTTLRVVMKSGMRKSGKTNAKNKRKARVYNAKKECINQEFEIRCSSSFKLTAKLLIA
ncbi:hypothetical protein JS578_14680 (plasmid) [Dysgonomonadaceae bacterium zrk40]|nr:hypothetical protein JS578_14680 [Dysgonomonadaceae bacterium zrk40]